MHSRLEAGQILRMAGLALTVVACSESLPMETETLRVGAVRYEIVAGDAQSAPVGNELDSPLVVRVSDVEGRAIEGQIVNWIVTSGGGSVFAGRALTDSLGYAREWWTLGSEPGDNRIEARAVNSTTGEALVFARFEATATDPTVEEATPPPAAMITIAGTAYETKGAQKVDLSWSGATTSLVEIVRDGQLLASTANDGSHHDPIDARGGGTYRYRVCERGGGPCSGELQLTF